MSEDEEALVDDGAEWVTIARFDDPVEAEMTCDFLRSHHLRIRQLGNAPQVAVLNRFATIVDIRIAVRKEDLEEAEEALAALRSERSDTHPYRGAEDSSVARQREPEAEKGPKKKYRRAAFVLALVLPIASGHFYAQHGAAATVLLAGILGGFLATILAHATWTFTATILLVAGDAVLSPWAVKRYNAGVVPSEMKQRGVAAAAVLAAYVIAYLTSNVF